MKKFLICCLVNKILWRNPETFIEMLNLPEYVFPVSGLVVGYPKNIPDQKPRLPRDAIHHKEQYNLDVQEQLMNEYDETISAYLLDRTNGNKSASWSSQVSNFYETGFEAYAKNVTPYFS